MRCPIDGTKLANADSELIARLNESIAAGELRDRLDQRISKSIEAALVTVDQKRIYLVRGGIPTLIADEAIERA
ncbi:MAG: Trm112 family protein [Pirellulaceae bacterium]